MATMQQLEQTLLALKDSNGDVRKNGEAHLEELKKQPEWLIPSLLEFIKATEGDAARKGTQQMATLILSKCMGYKEFKELPAAAQAQVKAGLLELFQGLTESKPRRIVQDIISSIGTESMSNNSWPELSGFLLQAVAEGNPLIKVGTIEILANLLSLSEEDQFKASVKNILTTCLEDESLPVRVASCVAVCSYAAINEKDTVKMNTLIPSLLNVLGQTLAGGDSDGASEMLQSLCDSLEANPKFFESNIMNLLNTMFQIAQSSNIPDNLRHLSVEAIVTYAEAQPRTVKKVQGFIPRFVPFLMEWLLTVEEPSQDWMDSPEDEDDEDEVSYYDVGMDALDRLAIAVGGAAFEKPLTQEVMKFATQHADSWRHRHAAVLALSQCAEGCQKEFSTKLAGMVPQILNYFNDEHLRVQYIAVQCIAQFCIDFSPSIQADYHKEIVPKLLMMFSNPCARTRGHAASSIINFCDEVDSAIYRPYLDQMLKGLFDIVTNDTKLFVRERALTAVAALADMMDESDKLLFEPYYVHFMPVVKEIISMPESEEFRKIKGKALETALVMACVVGKERFRAGEGYGDFTINYMVTLQQQELPEDDPRKSALMQGWAKLAKCLGPDFKPFLAPVLTNLLAILQNTEDVTLMNEHDEAPEDDDHAVITLAIKGHGRKKLVIKTSVLEEKSLALDMLSTYFVNVNTEMFDHITEIANVIVEMVDNPYQAEIRETVATVAPAMLKCVKDNIESGRATMATLHELLNYIARHFLEAIKSETCTATCVALVENFFKCVSCVGQNSLTPENLEKTILFQTVFSDALKRHADLKQDHKTQEGDEYEQAKLDDEAEAEEALLEVSAEAVGVLLKTQKPFMATFLSQYLPYFTQMLDPAKYGAVVRRLAICVFCDFVEHGEAAALPYFHDIVAAMLANLPSDIPEAMQPCAYGLGLCAEYSARTNTPFQQGTLQAIVQGLVAVLAKGPREDDDWDEPIANVAHALVKILRHFNGQPGVTEADVLPPIFPHLPLSGDAGEAIPVHSLLFDLTLQQHPVMLGQNNSNVPAIAGVAKQLMSAAGDKVMIDEATRAKIQQLGALLGN